MTLSLKIKMDNAAFCDEKCYEASRILHDLARRLTEHSLDKGDGGVLLDINGNKVGEWKVK